MRAAGLRDLFFTSYEKDRIHPGIGCCYRSQFMRPANNKRTRNEGGRKTFRSNSRFCGSLGT